MTKIVKTAVAVTVATLALGVAAPAMASGRDAGAPMMVITKSGSCGAGDTWLLTVKPDAGRLEADVEVQTRTAGQTWNSTFSDNGTVFAHATKVTGADGSFSATRYAVNQAGSDVITVKSKNVTTGETCLAAATF